VNILISGVLCKLGLRLQPPDITVDRENDTIELEYFLSDSVSVIGSIENINGTIDEVQSMVDDNRHAFYFSLLGSVNAHTGVANPMLARLFGNDCLDGSSLYIHTVKTSKELIQPILDIEHQVEHESSKDSETNDLHILSRAVPYRKDLVKATEQRETLLRQNMVLALSRSLFQTLRVNHSEGLFSVELEEGNRFNYQDQSFWRFYVPSDKMATIPLSSIVHVNTRLSSIPWSLPEGPLYIAQPQFLEDTFFLVLKYNGSLTAYYSWDETVQDVDEDALPDGLLNYVIHKLHSTQPGATTNYQGPEPDLTMRLVCLDVCLETIRDRLDALGIAYDTDEHGEQVVDQHQQE